MAALDRFLPINAILALVTPNELWPPILSDAGYRLAGLEIPSRTERGSVTLDVVLVHAHTNQLLVFEAKSGANVAADQARRLAVLDANAVARGAKAALTGSERPDVQVAYVCLAEHTDRIMQGLGALDLQFPVIAIGTSIDVHNAALPGRLADDLTCDVRLAPPRILRHDAQTTAEELESYVLAELVRHQAHRTPHITLPTLTEGAVSMYPMLGSRAQQALRKQVRTAAERLAAARPDTYRVVRGAGSPDQTVVEILYSPENYRLQGRTQGYQRLRATTGVVPSDEAQLDIFDQLDDELDEFEGADEELDDEEGIQDDAEGMPREDG